MFSKIKTAKFSFLTGSVVYLLSSVAFAQTTLDLVEEDENTPLQATVNFSENENGNVITSADDQNQPTETLNNEEINNEDTPADTMENNDTEEPGAIEGDTQSDSNNEEGQNTNSEDGEAPSNDSNLAPNSENSPNNKPNPPKQEEDDAVIKAYNDFMDKVDRQSLSSENPNSAFGDKILDQVKEDLFSQMADIEKQTSLLTLELKREKIKDEIAAMHAKRQKAADQEREKQLEKERKQAEWEKAQERKLLEEQQKLKQLEIKYEKLRQEKVLKAYKENMLKTNQKWVEYNARLYNQLIKEEKIQNDLITKQKNYFKNLSEAINKIKSEAEQAKDKYNQEVMNLQTQIAILKSKLEAEKAAYEESQKTGPNPFALVEEENGSNNVKVADEYAIMEISGKGNVLVAKLINKNGGTFMVKPGTILNTGHIVEEITQTYIVTDKAGIKDYLYFSAGGILDKEPTETISGNLNAGAETAPSAPSAPKGGGIPSLRSGMFVE